MTKLGQLQHNAVYRQLGGYTSISFQAFIRVKIVNNVRYLQFKGIAHDITSLLTYVAIEKRTLGCFQFDWNNVGNHLT